MLLLFLIFFFFIFINDINSIILNGQTKWYVNGDFARNEAISYQLAIKDLRLDWYKRFSFTPTMYNFNNIKELKPGLYFGTFHWLNEFKDIANQLHICNLKDSFEAHCIIIITLENNEYAMIITGNHIRGSIYALYTFSEEILGVDPFYLFTDHEPELISNNEIYIKKPVNTTIFVKYEPAGK